MSFYIHDGSTSFRFEMPAQKRITKLALLFSHQNQVVASHLDRRSVRLVHPMNQRVPSRALFQQFVWVCFFRCRTVGIV